jgi:hypothetical protein
VSTSRGASSIGLVALLASALGMAACGSDGAGAPAPSVVATSTSVPVTVVPTTEAELITVAPPDPGVDPAVQDDVNNSIGDLVERLGISAEDVTVIAGRATTWPDASFGCPKPGVQYVQVQVDGSIVILEAGGKRYEYHTGGRGFPELCERTPSVDATATS